MKLLGISASLLFALFVGQITPPTFTATQNTYTAVQTFNAGAAMPSGVCLGWNSDTYIARNAGSEIVVGSTCGAQNGEVATGTLLATTIDTAAAAFTVTGGAAKMATIQAIGTNNVSGCSLTAALGGGMAGKFASGTTGTCTVTITPGNTSTTGFACSAQDLTTPADIIGQTAFGTTTATISGTTASGDVITWKCIAF